MHARDGAAHLEALKLLETGSSFFLLTHGGPDVSVNDVGILDRLRHKPHAHCQPPGPGCVVQTGTNTQEAPASKDSVMRVHASCTNHRGESDSRSAEGCHEVRC